MDKPSKVEFCIKINSLKSVDNVKKQLNDFGVKSDQIETVVDSHNKECRLVIETMKPWIELQEKIESTGTQAVLVGFSDESAVVMLDKGDTEVKGVFRFCSVTANSPGIVIDGVVDGLPLELNQILKPDIDHILKIHEFGDFSDGFSSLGDIYKNSSYKITPDNSGRATLRTVDNNLRVSELIGRSLVVSSTLGTNLSCGIISRAAGVFENWKRICACDGVTIWDERDRRVKNKQ